MANTNKLRSIVEPALAKEFETKYHCRLLRFSTKELKNIFLGMEPDLVAISDDGITLYIGEITTSGFLGRKGKDFHVGGVKKVFEAFSKFYLFSLSDNNATILNRLKHYYPSLESKVVSYHFIVPRGSRFVKALGYREGLFRTGLMHLDLLPLSPNIQNIMEETLNISKDEQMLKI